MGSNPVRVTNKPVRTSHEIVEVLFLFSYNNSGSFLSIRL